MVRPIRRTTRCPRIIAPCTRRMRPGSRPTRASAFGRIHSRTATLSMVHNLAVEAEKHWRKINGYALIEKVIRGVTFEDGVEKAAA